MTPLHHCAPRAARTLSALAALALVACGGASTKPDVEGALPRTGLSEMQPPVTHEEMPEPEREPIQPPDEAALTLVELNIDPLVSERCGPIELPTPMFRFDSDQPTPEAAAYIRRLGECLDEGPLQAAQVVLIGHTDPWGEGDYNEQLARRRARQVARLLRAEGVAGERIAIQSEGERAARAEPGHWPLERRVDIAVKL